MAFYAVGWGFDNRDCRDRIRKPLSLFFFFFFFQNRLVAAAVQAAEIEELSYVKKHLDVYDSKMILMFMT